MNIKYTSNSNAWLTREIFAMYMSFMNTKMQFEHRKILVVLDNFSGHIISDLSNIQFCFLPANTTSILQPLFSALYSHLNQNIKNY